MDASLIECLCVASSIAQVFSIGDSIIVRTGKVLLGTHIYIVVFVVIQHRIDACNAGYADGAWR